MFSYHILITSNIYHISFYFAIYRALCRNRVKHTKILYRCQKVNMFLVVIILPKSFEENGTFAFVTSYLLCSLFKKKIKLIVNNLIFYLYVINRQVNINKYRNSKKGYYMRFLNLVSGKIKGIRIKSFKGAVAASVIMHAVIITGLGFYGAGTSDMPTENKLALEEEITTKEYEVSFVNLEPEIAEIEITESEALASAPAKPGVEIQGEEPSPMELITYRTETTVLTSATGKPRGYISGAVVENVEFAYLVVNAPPPPPPAEKAKDLFYYLLGGNQSGVGSSGSGYGRGTGTIAVGACPSPNIININRPK